MKLPTRPRTGRILKLAAAASLLALMGCSTAPRMTRAEPGFHASIGSGNGNAIIRVYGTRAPVTVLLDSHGVPFISAADENDLSFALGYMHGRDRRFQMELLRMDSQGRLREFLGGNVPAAILRLELFSRMLGFPAEAAEIYSRLGPEDRRSLQAYADGVNEATRREESPIEFGFLNYEPDQWTPVDSLSILALISFGFCKDWEQELSRLELMVSQLKAGSTIERALKIWPPRFDLPPHLIGEKPRTDPFADIPVIAPELAEYLTEKFKGNAAPASAGDQREGTDALSSGLNLRMSSNNWAVDGMWTGTGKSAIAFDPHMPLSLPPLLYISAITLSSADGGGYEVMGAAIPGLPALPFGTNGKVAWGPTSNWADVTDLYVEKQAPGRPGYYMTENGEEPFTVRTETFKIRAGRGFRTEIKTVRGTRHGAVVNDFMDRLPPDFPIVTLRRAQTFGESLRSMGRLYRASSVTEARSALEGFTVLVGNWALADAAGSRRWASRCISHFRRTPRYRRI